MKIVRKNHRNKYIEQPCRLCGEVRLVRLVHGEPVNDTCHYCAVRTREYRNKLSGQIKLAWARGDYAT